MPERSRIGLDPGHTSRLGEPRCPVAHTDRIGGWFANKIPNNQRKIQGDFFAPVQIRSFIVKQIEVKKNAVRVFDPTAGKG